MTDVTLAFLVGMLVGLIPAAAFAYKWHRWQKLAEKFSDNAERYYDLYYQAKKQQQAWMDRYFNLKLSRLMGEEDTDEVLP